MLLGPLRARRAHGLVAEGGVRRHVVATLGPLDVGVVLPQEPVPGGATPDHDAYVSALSDNLREPGSLLGIPGDVDELTCRVR